MNMPGSMSALTHSQQIHCLIHNVARYNPSSAPNTHSTIFTHGTCWSLRLLMSLQINVHGARCKYRHVCFEGEFWMGNIIPNNLTFIRYRDKTNHSHIWLWQYLAALRVSKRNRKLWYSSTNVTIINTIVIKSIEDMNNVLWDISSCSYNWKFETAVDIMISGKPTHFHKNNGLIRRSWHSLTSTRAPRLEQGDHWWRSNIYIFRMNIKYLLVM